MTGLKAHAVHLYPRWVLSRGNGTLMCISRQPLSRFAPFLLQWSLFILRTSKHQKSPGLVRWLVRYSIWLLKNLGSRRGRLGMGPLTCRFQAKCIGICISELSLKRASCGAHTLRACKSHTHFGPQCPPSATFLIPINLFLFLSRKSFTILGTKVAPFP